MARERCREYVSAMPLLRIFMVDIYIAIAFLIGYLLSSDVFFLYTGTVLLIIDMIFYTFFVYPKMRCR